MTWAELYSASLASGLLPDQFWDMTFFELTAWRSSIVEREKLEWRRHSTLLSLIYNINRGKGKKMSPADFFPFAEEEVSGISSKEDVDALVALLEANQQKLKQNG